MSSGGFILFAGTRSVRASAGSAVERGFKSYQECKRAAAASIRVEEKSCRLPAASAAGSRSDGKTRRRGSLQ